MILVIIVALAGTGLTLLLTANAIASKVEGAKPPLTEIRALAAVLAFIGTAVTVRLLVLIFR